MEKSRAQQRREKKKKKKVSGPKIDDPNVNSNQSKKKIRPNEPEETINKKAKQHHSGKSTIIMSGLKHSTSSSLTTMSFSIRVIDATNDMLEEAQTHSTYHDILADEALKSDERAKLLLGWIVAPVPVEEFMNDYYEKKPLLIRRKSNSNWYEGLLSKKAIEKTLSIQRLIQGQEVTLSRYDPIQKIRVNLHQEGLPLLLSKFTSALKDDGASVRLLAPQKHHEALWAVMSGLEEAFGAMVGANSYLTPSGEQGFAPHFDDIEAFIIQLEGKKKWSIYTYPESKQGEEEEEEDIDSDDDDEYHASKKKKTEYTGEACPLPRYSSEDFKPDELPPLLMETVLEPGDFLFLPRGFVHQAETVPVEDNKEGYSLHLTLSTAQNNAWADFVELLIPQAVASAVAASVSMRASLPIDYLTYTGVVNSDLMERHLIEESRIEQEEAHEEDDDLPCQGNPSLDLPVKRSVFLQTLKGHLDQVVEHAMDMADASADQMAKRYLSDRLPPVLSEWEEQNSAEGSKYPEAKLKEILMFGSSLKKTSSNVNSTQMRSGDVGTKVRMLRQGLARLCIEDGMAVVYHCYDNARWHHGATMNPLEFPLEDAPALDALINAYPDPILVKDLPHPSSTEDLETKAEITEALFKEGFLVLVDDE